VRCSTSAHDLVAGWERWIDLSLAAGAALDPLLGRAPGSTVELAFTTPRRRRGMISHSRRQPNSGQTRR